MKKAFTLMELIVVLIIMGILATIATEILLKVFKAYTISRAQERLAYRTDIVINEIASKLQNRIKNSVIADECNATKNECINGNITEFISINNLTPKNAYKYPVIEWIAKDFYSKRGEWNDTLKRNIHGWSGFVDLKKTAINNANTGDYNITIPYSKMSIIQDIEGNWSKCWGVSGYSNVFNNNLSVLIFSGPDGRGDFNDINNSYGWWKSKYPNNKAQKIFSIKNIITDDLNHTAIRIKAVDDDNESTVYEGFFISNGANAIVPVYNSSTNDYNLTFIQNYFPWKGEDYTDGNSSLLAEHVIQFKFKEVNGLLNIYLCIQDPDVKIDNNEYLTICKEKVVF